MGHHNANAHYLPVKQVSNADLLKAVPSAAAAMERLNAPLDEQELAILDRFSTHGFVPSTDPDVVYGVTTVGDLLALIPNEGDRTHVGEYEVTNKGAHPLDTDLSVFVVDSPSRQEMLAKPITELRKLASKAGLPNAYKGGYSKADLVEFLVKAASE